MTTLAADVLRDFQLGDLEELPVIASDIIFAGAAVGENASGYSRPLQAGDAFQGFAMGKVDNSAGSAGDERVTVRRRGYVVLTVANASGVAVNDMTAVYASDDNTFTTSPTSNSLIGWVSRWISGTDCVVYFDAFAVRAALAA